MRITITVGFDETTPTTVQYDTSQTPGSNSIDTGPANIPGSPAASSAGPVYVMSPQSEGPPPFLPEPTDAAAQSDNAPGALSAGPAPSAASILPGSADPGTIGGTT